jgi:hypothetical protein
MSSDPLVSAVLEDKNKNQPSKKLLIAGGISCSLAVAYLLASSGRSSHVPDQDVEEFFEFPKGEFKKAKNLIKETCSSSFDRIWEDNLGNYL